MFRAMEILEQFRLDGKVAVVTGASRGLGRVFAEGIAGAGADVVITGRDMATLKPVAEEIAGQTGRRIHPVCMDVGNLDDIRRTVAEVREVCGRLDILVNNAGVNHRETALDFREEDWDRVVDVNLKGTFFMCQTCGRAMKEQGGGKIVTILSLTSGIGLPTVVPYTAAKGGMMQITKMLAVEWAEHNIQVNGIAPGFFRTELTKAVQEDERNNWILNRTPMERWGEPEELLGAMLLFCSPASDFITGQMIYVDGGFMAGSDWRKGK
ncbi:MAG: glucose 1-dehydrogenase [Armatimonadetes bacterium]|nr:glucose 1-dehydrogenase [Armatimonadota bacterium]PIU63540.1 MAG: gluconate 5-dehydrogenase [Armatimonadetes bacterium CG07_land_8_20_14_0_80_59_28]PIX40550.1 MAG: gluconate 5-dehydrogenase [Armatimonadetes bacterium CG_4_8_14_3_um_filter_58_9]PIY48506.1 MAG: gluconate 5-dehydrogenase [Armatimonadetes bacterium CG_4_10_14_3_um_filter_59_10]PJB61951.1 MAG: gluconate 5-dehydrogenase [Armatimonadetes bacterium CG_4_9_14_3_um_filter_58_7]